VCHNFKRQKFVSNFAGAAGELYKSARLIQKYQKYKNAFGSAGIVRGSRLALMEMFNKGEREHTVLHHHLRSGSFDAAPLSNMTSDIKRIPPVVLLTMAARGGNRGIFDNQPPRADCAARKVFFIITHSLSLSLARIYILITNAAAVLQINVNALFQPRVCVKILPWINADENRNLHSCASPLLFMGIETRSRAVEMQTSIK
jgi:hypothetical protein